MDGGLLGIQLRNRRFLNKNSANNADPPIVEQVACALIEPSNAEQASNTPNLAKEFEEMKTMLVNDTNLSDMKASLKRTLPYRLALLNDLTENMDQKDNLRELFPYIFTSYELVRFIKILYSKL